MRIVKIVVLTVFGMVLLQAVTAEILLRTHRFSAKDKPSWLEAMFARHARNVSTPANAKALKNPRMLDEGTRYEAREHWVEHCSLCHGVDGKGETVIGRNLFPPASDMNDALTQQKTDGELFYIISNGIRLTGMPAWEREDSPESIWDLVAFIRQLPQLSPEELNQMKELAREGKEETGGERDDRAGDKSAPNAGDKTSEAHPVGPHKDKPGAKPHSHSHEH